MEGPVDITTNTSKKLKNSAESIPANLNPPNRPRLARKLFGTPDSKELLMQAHLKVTLVVVAVVVVAVVAVVVVAVIKCYIMLDNVNSRK
jgi:hypothetical protein